MALPLVVGLRLALLAATVGGTRSGALGELDLTADGGERHAADRGWRAGGDLAVTLYLGGRRVVDDATPLALQPFLQRASTARLGLGGAGYRLGPLGLDHDGAGWQARATLAVDVYVSESFALVGRAGVTFDRYSVDDHDGFGPGTVAPGVARSSLVLDGEAALAYRVADLRVDLGLTLAPRRDEELAPAGASQAQADAVAGRRAAGFAPSVRPGGLLRLRTVLLEHIDIAATVRSLERGAGADVTIDYYPSHRVGLLSGIGGAHERLRPELPESVRCVNDAPTATAVAAAPCVGDRLGLRVGFSFWASPRFGLVALYTPTFYAPTLDAAGTVDNRVSVTLSSRF